MGSAVQCRPNPVDRGEVRLRRFVTKGPDVICLVSPSGYHEASVAIARIPLSEIVERQLTDSDKLDPVWPLCCVCGRAFDPDDDWQMVVAKLPEGSEGEDFFSSPKTDREGISLLEILGRA